MNLKTLIGIVLSIFSFTMTAQRADHRIAMGAEYEFVPTNQILSFEDSDAGNAFDEEYSLNRVSAHFNYSKGKSPWLFMASLGYSFGHTNVSRTYQSPVGFSELKGVQSSTTFDVQIGAGYDIALSRFHFTPKLAMRYYAYAENAFDGELDERGQTSPASSSITSSSNLAMVVGSRFAFDFLQKYRKPVASVFVEPGYLMGLNDYGKDGAGHSWYASAGLLFHL